MAVLFMRVVVPSYAYTMIKIASLKSLIIPQNEFLKLQRISDVRNLINSIDQYYPGLNTALPDYKPSIIQIEKELYNVYMKIFEKILASSPIQLQKFLRSILYRYEIWNLKTLLAGTLAKMDKDAIQNEILMKPEELLQRTKFMNDLLKQREITYIMRILSKSRYAKVIKRGFYYFEQTKEIFLLEALLDKFYVEYLHEESSEFKGIEKVIFNNYVDTMVQKYNLMLIFRSYRNNIPKSLLHQLILPSGSIFTSEIISDFITSDTRADFISKLKNVINRNDFFRKTQLQKYTIDSELLTHILSVLNKNIFQKLEESDIADIDALTIKRVLSFIFNKENEIYRVLGLFVKAIYKMKD
ncbi:MAG: V-type ATPase subunit [Candidatus Lokiarchaeota archaeon]|nr:V-type ATPase subunit [Candidatus Lokiarchaeota archaeon]